MLTGFGKEVLVHKFTASAVKRMMFYVVDAGFISFVTPNWLAATAHYVSRWVSGGYAKAKTLAYIRPAEAPIMLDEQAYDVSQEQTEDGYKLSWKHPLRSAGTFVAHVADKGAEFVVNLTYREAAKESGAFIGSYIATAGFVMYFGAPTLLTLPLYYIMEAPVRAVGSYAMHKGCKYAIGDDVYHPMLEYMTTPRALLPPNTDDPDAHAQALYTPEYWKFLENKEAQPEPTLNVVNNANPYRESLPLEYGPS